MSKIDKYEQKFINSIKKATSDTDLAIIIDAIYADGYSDGFNDTENNN
jgi:hypothetical protein